MSQIVPFTANRSSTGVTQAVGVANTLTKIITLQVQPGMNLLLDRNTVLMLKDNGVTESSGSSVAQIVLVNARTSKTDVRAEPTYSQLKFNQDANLQYRPFRSLAPNQAIKMTPFSLLQVYLKSDQTAQIASLDFYLEAKAEE